MAWQGGFSGVGYTREEFRKYLGTKPKPPYHRVVIHNTDAPYIKPPVLPSQRVRNISEHYKNMGWSAGPDFFVFHDGRVYLGSPMGKSVGCKGWNGNSFHLEAEGKYTKASGHDPHSGHGKAAWDTMAWVTAELLEWMNWDATPERIKLHKEGATTHDCPGALITKAWLIPKVKDAMATDFRPENVDKPAPKPTVPNPGRAVLKKGMTGGDVPVLQRWLKTKGYYTSLVDGDFGPKTHEAVKAAQKALGLVVDGIVGPKTWAAMANAPEKPDVAPGSPSTPTGTAEPKPTVEPVPAPPKPAEHTGNTPIEDLHPSDFALSWMKRFEGLRLTAYDDVGSWAIGWGHNTTSNRPPKVYQGMTITEAEAVEILKNDAEAIAAEVRKVLKGIRLTQHQFDALVLDNFQRGQTQFTKTEVVQALKEGRDASPAFHAQATTSKNAGLNRRRKIEALIFDGQSPTKW
jgi:GH24 family phage-related lysozyme (muramidase)